MITKLKDGAQPDAGEDCAVKRELDVEPEPDNERLVAALRERNPDAAAELFDRFAPDINRLVWSMLGADPDHDDVVQQVGMNMLRSAHTIREPRALRAWVVRLTVNSVRTELLRRRRRRWLRFDTSAQELLEPHLDDHDARSAVKRAYAVLRRLPADEQTAFVLRHIEGQSLEEGAESCGWSLATFKRRLKEANERVRKIAAHEPELVDYLRGDGGEEP